MRDLNMRLCSHRAFCGQQEFESASLKIVEQIQKAASQKLERLELKRLEESALLAKSESHIKKKRIAGRAMLHKVNAKCRLHGRPTIELANWLAIPTLAYFAMLLELGKRSGYQLHNCR